MMYQRDIYGVSLSGAMLAEEAQQPANDRAKERINGEKEDGEDHGHDQHHDRGAEGLAPGRPDDLRRFVAHLPDKFAWGCLRHCSARLRIEKRPADLCGRRGWMRLSDTTPSLQGVDRRT